MLKVQTFLGKVNIEGLNQMDAHLNNWLKRTKVKPVQITTNFGHERGKGANEEPVLIISIWYEAEDAENDL